MAFRISRDYSWFLRDMTNKQEELTDGFNADDCLKRDGLQKTRQILSFHDRMMFFYWGEKEKIYWSESFALSL